MTPVQNRFDFGPPVDCSDKLLSFTSCLMIPHNILVHTPDTSMYVSMSFMSMYVCAKQDLEQFQSYFYFITGIGCIIIHMIAGDDNDKFIGLPVCIVLLLQIWSLLAAYEICF